MRHFCDFACFHILEIDLAICTCDCRVPSKSIEVFFQYYRLCCVTLPCLEVFIVCPLVFLFSCIVDIEFCSIYLCWCWASWLVRVGAAILWLSNCCLYDPFWGGLCTCWGCFRWFSFSFPYLLRWFSKVIHSCVDSSYGFLTCMFVVSFLCVAVGFLVDVCLFK